MMRYLSQHLVQQLSPKITLISGPRQVGKATLARSLRKSYAYYNYDDDKASGVFRRQEWDRQKGLVIFDELHKMRKWKLWLKGLYDTERRRLAKATGVCLSEVDFLSLCLSSVLRIVENGVEL